MVPSSSSSSSSSAASIIEELPSKPHQVFINFRRIHRHWWRSTTDLHTNFISHLEAILKREKVKYYIDRNEVPSEPIDILFKRIDESDIVLAVFSKKYSESKWCLHELVRIMKNMKQMKQRVIPIFFDVEVNDVKYQKGEFGQNFYKKHYSEATHVTDAWKEALRYATTELALVSADFRNDSDFVAFIVKMVKLVRMGLLTSITLEDKGKDSFNTLDSSEGEKQDMYSITRENLTVEGEEELETKEEFDRTCPQSFSSSVLHLSGPDSPMDHEVRPPQHQVFINFRGDELRRNFISHLVEALERNEINLFTDKQEKRGKCISNLFERIEESRIAIVVFSKRYTESKWCLDELVKIKECMDLENIKVLPVFYNVTTNDVKRLKGEFSDHLRDREKEFEHDQNKIKQWKEALWCVSGILGLTFHSESLSERDFIGEIVKNVLIMLQEVQTNKLRQRGETSSTRRGSTSLEPQVQELRNMLSKWWCNYTI